METYQLKDAKEVRTLRSIYGEDIILFDEQDESTVFRILSEFALGEQEYAILQSNELKKENEIAIFRIGKNREGQPEVETIEDDDEWENVSEIYDEMTFPMSDDL